MKTFLIIHNSLIWKKKMGPIENASILKICLQLYRTLQAVYRIGLGGPWKKSAQPIDRHRSSIVTALEREEKTLLDFVLIFFYILIEEKMFTMVWISSPLNLKLIWGLVVLGLVLNLHRFYAFWWPPRTTAKTECYLTHIACPIVKYYMI